jgi:hypothetical protein
MEILQNFGIDSYNNRSYIEIPDTSRDIMLVVGNYTFNAPIGCKLVVLNSE